ncbi:MAG: 6-bladed beta-propeller [Candidatus Aminicenantes bacterium]
MKKIKFLPLILVVFFCCGPKQDEVERFMEEGVEVIVNHLEPHLIKGELNTLHLEEEFTIDFEREDLREIGIREIIGLDVDSDGNIYFIVSRSDADLILKFDADGKFILSFGRRGEGPGELIAPRYLRVDESERIQIADNNRKKIYIFEKNGSYIKAISLPSNHRIATLLENGNILAVKNNFNKDIGRGEYPIILSNEGLEEIKMLHPGLWMPNIVLSKRINPLRIYMDYNVLRPSNGRIYVGNYGKGYEFLIYDTEGNLLRKIKKEYHSVKVPDQLKEEIVNWMTKNFDSFEQYKNKVYFPEFHPPFQFFFLDEENRLYVMTYEQGHDINSFIYDIFNPEGLFIGRIELDNYGSLPFSVTEIPVPLDVVAKNNRIYCLREKESGYKELVVYKMRWE